MKPVAIITGASGGIGQGIAELFLSRDYHVVLHTHSKPEALTRLLNQYPASQAVVFQGDLTDKNKTEALALKAIETFGRIDVLVNNAGLKIDGAIDAMRLETFNQVMAVNLTSVFLMIKAVVPIMKKQKHGSIIHLGSGIGYQGRPLNVNYAASKAALIGLIPSLAKELGPYQIRVNGVAPGLIPTEMTSYYSKEDQEIYRESVPLKRLATPLDIGKAVYFLASDEAAFITGQTLFVNGGTQTH
jgi:3-oxoacyl-[acyl-carrier protein] reductase